MRGREPGDDAHVAEARGGEQFGGPGNLGPDPAPVELVGGYDYLASYVHSQQRAPLDALMNRLTAIDPEYRRGFGDAHVPAGRRLESGSGGRELGELGTKAVSYTHLDVYKRQLQHHPDRAPVVSTASGRQEAMSLVHAVASSPDHAVAPAVEALEDPEASAEALRHVLVGGVHSVEGFAAEVAVAEGGDPLPAHEATKIIGEVLAELE